MGRTLLVGWCVGVAGCAVSRDDRVDALLAALDCQNIGVERLDECVKEALPEVGPAGPAGPTGPGVGTTTVEQFDELQQRHDELFETVAELQGEMALLDARIDALDAGGGDPYFAASAYLQGADAQGVVDGYVESFVQGTYPEIGSLLECLDVELGLGAEADTVTLADECRLFADEAGVVAQVLTANDLAIWGQTSDGPLVQSGLGDTTFEVSHGVSEEFLLSSSDCDVVVLQLALSLDAPNDTEGQRGVRVYGSDPAFVGASFVSVQVHDESDAGDVDGSNQTAQTAQVWVPTDRSGSIWIQGFDGQDLAVADIVGEVFQVGCYRGGYVLSP